LPFETITKTIFIQFPTQFQVHGAGHVLKRLMAHYRKAVNVTQASILKLKCNGVSKKLGGSTSLNGSEVCNYAASTVDFYIRRTIFNVWVHLFKMIPWTTCNYSSTLLTSSLQGSCPNYFVCDMHIWTFSFVRKYTSISITPFNPTRQSPRSIVRNSIRTSKKTHTSSQRSTFQCPLRK
jgi:hypothetical protein